MLFYKLLHLYRLNIHPPIPLHSPRLKVRFYYLHWSSLFQKIIQIHFWSHGLIITKHIFKYNLCRYYAFWVPVISAVFITEHLRVSKILSKGFVKLCMLLIPYYTRRTGNVLKICVPLEPKETWIWTEFQHDKGRSSASYIRDLRLPGSYLAMADIYCYYQTLPERGKWGSWDRLSLSVCVSPQITFEPISRVLWNSVGRLCRWRWSRRQTSVPLVSTIPKGRNASDSNQNTEIKVSWKINTVLINHYTIWRTFSFR
jgi:hypothetical protein